MKSTFIPRALSWATAGLLSVCFTAPAHAYSYSTYIPIIRSQAPSHCRFIGNVAASDVNGSTQMYNTHQYFEADEINRLRAQAASFGANLIVLTYQKATYMPRPGGGAGSIYNFRESRPNNFLDTHAMGGKAYVCSGSTIASIRGLNNAALSDVQPWES